MAKAKKSETTPASTPAPAPKSAKKPAAKAKSGAPAPAPAIDPAKAAVAAAAMVGSGLATAPTGATTPTKAESTSFKQLKQGLNKPAGSALGGLLDKTAPAGQKKSNLPFNPGGRQVGHNQTFGADVNRSGVPRRTGG